MSRKGVGYMDVTVKSGDQTLDATALLIPEGGIKGTQKTIGTPEDGFEVSLRYTDRRYLSISKKTTECVLQHTRLKFDMKELKDETLEPIQGALDEGKVLTGAFERLAWYYAVVQALELARISSIEENLTFVVYVIARDNKSLTDWVQCRSAFDYRDDCAEYGNDKVLEIDRYEYGVARSVIEATVKEENSKEGAA